MRKVALAAVAIVTLASAQLAYAEPVKRGPNWVDYEQPDGKQVVEVYTGPINYLENGTYLPIDPTIRYDAEGHYVRKGIYKVRWNKNSSVRIEKTAITFSTGRWTCG